MTGFIVYFNTRFGTAELTTLIEMESEWVDALSKRRIHEFWDHYEALSQHCLARTRPRDDSAAR